MECFLGVDIGSISTKGVIIDKDGNIYASSYLDTKGNPTDAVKRVILELRRIRDYCLLLNEEKVQKVRDELNSKTVSKVLK